MNIFEKKACKRRGNPYLESLSKILWRSPYRLARSRTLDFHSKNRGSNPRGDARGLRKNEAARKRGFFLFGLCAGRGWNFCDSKNPQGKRSAVQFHDFARGLLKKNEAAESAVFLFGLRRVRGWNFCDSKGVLWHIKIILDFSFGNFAFLFGIECVLQTWLGSSACRL